MPDLTITLTDHEMKCMQYAHVDPRGWGEHAMQNRARLAGLEIIEKLTTHCNENDIQLAVGLEAQVQQAFDLGVVKAATDVQADIDAYNAAKRAND